MSALLSHHAAELIDGSGIDPVIIARRGYRSVTAAETAAFGFTPTQQRDGLLIPQWTLAGAQVGHLLKPDERRLNDRGKLVKYEAPAGSVPHFDIHPDARHLLQDTEITLHFTEGPKKADSAWSRVMLCVSITSVWMFLNGRLVVPDLDEIPLEGRTVRVVFDSDVTRKDSVAEALLRFCAVLHRRGAKVEVVYLPEGPDGAKVGLDDWFVAGGTVDGLDELTRPWNGTGPGIWLRDGTESDVETLRRELTAARADLSALVQAILNPEVTRNQLIVAVAVASETLAKQRRGEVESNGKVVLSAAEIADDWRPAPAKGERVIPVNPRNGRRPRMAREKVNALMTEAVELELIPARPISVPRKHPNGSTYTATDWVVDRVDSIATALKPWATYRLAEPKARKPRTISPACPECGEVHPTRQIDYCGGCGAKLDERTIEPITAEEYASDNLSEAASPSTPAVKPSPSPALVRNVRQIIGGTGHNPAVAPALSLVPPVLDEPLCLQSAPDPWAGSG